jgi:hypothetical protein
VVSQQIENAENQSFSKMGTAPWGFLEAVSGFVEKSAGTWREHNMLVVKCESRAKLLLTTHTSRVKKETDPTANVQRCLYVEPTK